MIDRLQAHIRKGFELGTLQEAQLKAFRQAVGLIGPRPVVSAEDRTWHAETVKRAEAQMQREQELGHDASHTATKSEDQR